MGDGHLVDRTTQAWVRATGRRVDLTDHPWLDGPTGSPPIIGKEWVIREAERLGGCIVTADENDGLLASMGDLAGKSFDPSALRPEVVDFYEHTKGWRLELWFQWSPLAWPFGWVLSALFSRRLHQLSLPMC